MSTTFTCAEKLFLTSESVTEGHPDKVCDSVADAVLDEILRQDPEAHVACEVAATTGVVIILGEVLMKKGLYCNYEAVARRTITDIGYTSSQIGFDGATCAVLVAVKDQSPNIASAVSASLEVRTGEAADAAHMLGAGDQGMMIGFACNETPELMPLPISYAHKLCRRLAQVRKDGTLPYLRPDGKAQVTVQYCRGVPVRVDGIVVSAHHAPGMSQEQIRRDIKEHVIAAVVDPSMLDSQTKYWINPSGCFEVGGPVGDSGLSGRKIIVDTYGGIARHGGGSFSGKDPTKVDRSAAYMARYIAKNIVKAGIADRFELQVSYAIGKAEPVSLSVETYGTGRIPDDRIVELVQDNFNMCPGVIIERLDLRRPIYLPTAAYGHFGREDGDFPWEKTDMAESLRQQAGL